MMGRIVSFSSFLFFSLSLLVTTNVLASCDKDDYPDERSNYKHINICVLGNSYSDDAFSYVPFILKEYGITCKIHIYYRGSLSLHDLDEQWEDNASVGKADLDGANHTRLHFSIDTREQNKWKKENLISAKDILHLEKWDIVSIQQGGRRAKFIDTYYPYLQNVINRINTECPYSFSLAWFMAYNSARDNANVESLSTQRAITEEFPFDIVFPVAASVFSCQTHPILSELGDSKYKHMYASDDVHLQEGLPCYAAALVVSQTIIQMFFPEKTVIGDRIRPTQQWIRDINGITPNGESIGVDEDNCLLAQKAAMNAVNHKFEITPIE